MLLTTNAPYLPISDPIGLTQIGALNYALIMRLQTFMG